MVGGARVRDHDEGREPERAHADEAGAEGGAAFAGQGGDIRVPEQEGAGDGPFARLRGCFEDEGVGGIEPDRAGQLEGHEPRQTFGMPVAGSNQAGSRRASASDKRSRPAGRWIRRSPLPAMPRRSPALRMQAREIALGDRIEAVLRQGVEAEHEIAGEGLDEGRPVRLESLLLQGGRLRPRAGIAQPDPGRRHHALRRRASRAPRLRSMPPASRGVRRRSGRR